MLHRKIFNLKTSKNCINIRNALAQYSSINVRTPLRVLRTTLYGVALCERDDDVAAPARVRRERGANEVRGRHEDGSRTYRSCRRLT